MNRLTVEKKVTSFAEVDFSELEAIVVVYDKTTVDYPGEYVARIFDGKTGKPTNTFCTG